MSGARPTYGNFRRPQSPGLAQLGTIGSFVLLGFTLFTLFVGMTAAWFPHALVMGFITLGVVLPLVWKDRNNQTGIEKITDRLRHAWNHSLGRHRLQQGVVSRTPSTRCGLPGLAASLECADYLDGRMQPFAMIHNPKTRHCTVVFDTSPAGADLVDDAQIDAWVANWGRYLSDLSTLDRLVAASVTVETAPDPGLRLRQAVESQIDRAAPQLAQDTLAEIVATYPHGSAQTSCWVALTWSRGHGREEKTVPDMARDLAAIVPGLREGLSDTGAGSAASMTRADVAAACRGAFDPSSRDLIAEAGNESVEWSNAGPTNAQEHAQWYLHDEAVSVSWMLNDSPTSEVTSDCLGPLLSPHPALPIKRVSLLYRPFDHRMAARIVDEEEMRARGHAVSRRAFRARDSADMESARKQSRDQTAGAGLSRFGMIVTGTVLTDGNVPGDTRDLEAAVANLSTRARVHFRRASRAQAACFVANLPLGVVLPAYLAGDSDWTERWR